MLFSDRTAPRLRHVRAQLGRYAGALRWLAARLWRAFRWRLVRAVAAAQAGILVIGLGLSLSLYYAQRLEADEPLRFQGFAVSARDESTLAGTVAVILVVMMAGAALLFWAQWTIINMAAELNHHVRADVALAYGGQLPQDSDWRDNRSVERALWVLQTRDARRTAIVTRSLLRNTVHLAIVTIGFGALFYLQPRLTLVLAGAMLVALCAYYYVNTISVNATRRYEAVAPGNRRALHRVRAGFQTLSQPRLDRGGFDAALGRDAVAEETEAFRDRFGAQVYSDLLSFALMGVVLAGLIGYMGRQALTGEIPWTQVIAYVLVLRFALAGLRSLLNTFAFFSRFYPSINRLQEFFSATNSAISRDPLPELPLPSTTDALTQDDAATRPLRPTEVVGVTLPVALSRYSVGLLAAVFAGSDPTRRRRLLGHIAMAAPLSVPSTPASMQDLLLLDDRWDPETLRQRLGDQAAAVESTVGLDPAAAISGGHWAKLPPKAAGRLALVAAECSDRPLLAVDRTLVDEEWKEIDQHRRQGKIVLVCSEDPPEPDSRASRHLVVSEDGTLTAIGSPEWVKQNWEAIPLPRSRQPQSEEWTDEDLDEE